MVSVAIVGAGIAGLSCAYHAAKNGVEVTVYEKRDRVGFPIRSTGGIAAEYLNKAAVGFEEKWAYPLKKAIIVSPSGYRYDFSIDDQIIGYVLNQGEFESYLFEKARELGVKFVMPINVRVGTVAKLAKSYDFIVGADGAYSTVRKFLGIPFNGNLDMHKGYEYWIDGNADLLLPLPDNAILVYFNNEIAPKGYVWMFRYNDIIKLGLGVPVAHAESPKDILDRYIPRLVRGYSKSIILGRVGGVIPTPPPLDYIAKGNVALVGDAGNLINSATGGGIQMSLLSGRMCGESLASGGLYRYVSWYKNEAKPLLSRWYDVKQLLYSLDNKDFDMLVRTMSGFKIKSLNPASEMVRLLSHVMMRNPVLLIQFAVRLLDLRKILRGGRND